MTVKELKQILSDQPDDLEVSCAGGEIEIVVRYGDTITLDDNGLYHIDLLEEEPGHVLWSVREVEV